MKEPSVTHSRARVMRLFLPGAFGASILVSVAALICLIGSLAAFTQESGQSAIEIPLARTVAHELEGDPLTAIYLYNEILALDPDFAEAYWGCGNVRLLDGHTEEAISDYRRVPVIKPELCRNTQRQSN